MKLNERARMFENETRLNYSSCQIQSVMRSAEALGLKDNTHLSIWKSLRLTVKRMIGPGLIRSMKRRIKRRFPLSSNKEILSQNTLRKDTRTEPGSSNLAPGDWVIIRSEQEIKATLDPINELRGCAYMPEMSQYCGTVQRVLKPIMRFVDERDFKVKKASGIVLLEGVNCQGTEFYGGCDRSCFFFWREEWLKKTDGGMRNIQ
jgi:hypothetical protein